VNVNGTASLAATFGTVKFIWYNPTASGANPAYVTVARVPPNDTCNGIDRALFCCTV
jgi:hypothetical protein